MVANPGASKRSFVSFKETGWLQIEPVKDRFCPSKKRDGCKANERHGMVANLSLQFLLGAACARKLWTFRPHAGKSRKVRTLSNKYPKMRTLCESLPKAHPKSANPFEVSASACPKVRTLCEFSPKARTLFMICPNVQSYAKTSNPFIGICT